LSPVPAAAHSSTVTTGKSMRGPKIGLVKLNTKDETTYTVSVENGKIKVNVT